MLLIARLFMAGEIKLMVEGSDLDPAAAIEPLTKSARFKQVSILKRKVAEPLPATSVEEGIKAARLMFPKCYFDLNKTTRLVECLKRYRRDINQRTDEASGPLHDEYSHGADAFRYLGQAVDLMSNGDDGSIQKFKTRKKSWR